MVVTKDNIIIIFGCDSQVSMTIQRGSSDQGLLREAAKKVHPLMARPLRWGGGKGRAIKEKITVVRPKWSGL